MFPSVEPDLRQNAALTVILYSTTADEAEAKRIGGALVREKLAACVNILPKMRSIYRWKGNVEEADECVMIAKTTKDHADAATKLIRKLHSYELPCVIVISIIDGLDEYLEWIIEETR
ncbi:MAG: divalent-cation tolerance protein CutA [Candidatus Thermoplasmatota archaeon]|jgi:periplasmic divalent cation tolerance protein|nr:divalent-cation tolerance protein CutA [Candidatus Thermoplasmatota archaeon]MDP7266004.1 divalent-cation tolerance protein CutA [Candidatus Thermoplasmatota archaeon]